MPSVAEWWKNETFIPLEWSPSPSPGPTGPLGRWWLRWAALAAVVVLAASTGVLAWVAWDQHRLAQREQAVIHLQSAQLRALNSQVASTRQQLASRGQQLSSTGQQLSRSNTVAGELQACIDASSKASSDFFGFFSDSGHKADSICSSAETDYQALLSGG